VKPYASDRIPNMRTLLGCTVLALAVRLVAQTSAKVDVRVINVDVSVIGANSKPVTDLKRDDFEVLEDNQPQKITNFSLVDLAPGRVDPRLATDTQLRRRVILLVDNNYIDKSDRDNALRNLDEFVDSTFDGSYEWALGMIGQQLEIVQPFTTDKKAIHAAVARIRGSATTTYRDMMDRSTIHCFSAAVSTSRQTSNRANGRREMRAHWRTPRAA
jgi:VWFA-related protein